jgi:hypothetical protein
LQFTAAYIIRVSFQKVGYFTERSDFRNLFVSLFFVGYAFSQCFIKVFSYSVTTEKAFTFLRKYTDSFAVKLIRFIFIDILAEKLNFALLAW